MIGGLFRVVAFLLGLLLVLGGGACAVAGVPSFLMSLFSGAIGSALGIFMATAVGIGLLYIGVRMLKFAGGAKDEPDSTHAVNPDAYLGERFLISVTYVDQHLKQVDSLQMHGYAEECTSAGVRIALKGKCAGQYWTVPIASIRPAESGSFTIQSTGEVVTDPDYFAHITIKRPTNEGATFSEIQDTSPNSNNDHK